MDILQILKVICALATIVTGLISILRPHSIKGFTGLEADSPRAVSEIRSVLGGLFVGLGLAPLILASPAVYQAVGITYIAIAAVRAVSIVIDRAAIRSNIISLVVEVVFGLILVL